MELPQYDGQTVRIEQSKKWHASLWACIFTLIFFIILSYFLSVYIINTNPHQQINIINSCFAASFLSCFFFIFIYGIFDESNNCY